MAAFYNYSAGTDLCASREQSQACLSYAETKQSVRSNRVAARLGGGGLDALYHVIGNDVELQKKADILFKQSIEQVNSRVLNENNLDCIMSNEFAKEEFGHWIDGIPYQMQAGVELNHDQFKDMVNSMLDDINHGQEKEVYFYHSDHLGSASWITDADGNPVQHLQYLPYGEPFVDQRMSGYNERFTFTGKERDEETGFGYFGARYMDHELMTMWLSVDPMADKYPNISPYAYCNWNPVRLVDPDGKEVYINGDQADMAVERLQTKKMGLTRDNLTGKLSVSLRNGFSMDDLSNDEKQIFEAINAENISIQVRAEKSAVIDGKNAYRGNDGNLYQTFGGSFDGSIFLNDNGQKCAITYNYMDVELLDKNGFNQGVPHEISEQYLMGLKTLQLEKSIPCARLDKSNPEYDECHVKAVFQSSNGLHIGKIHIPPSIFGQK